MNARDPILEMITEWQEHLPDREEFARLSLILENLRFLERVKFTPLCANSLLTPSGCFRRAFSPLAEESRPHI
jgi:hypothetical protein